MEQLRTVPEASSPAGAVPGVLPGTRALTAALCSPLALEDHVVQPCDWVSPPKWHLAHTTWFFETFLLRPFLGGWEPSGSDWGWLFNSYYESLGERADKARRGTYSRPTVEEVYRYRNRVDLALDELLSGWDRLPPEARDLLALGLHHEQQHQELLLYDIKAILHHNPSRPAYGDLPEGFALPARAAGAGRWLEIPGGLADIGFAGEGFAFDNERPRHRVWLKDFRIEDRPVTNGRWLAFLEDGGYRRPGLWLSDGWREVSREGWRAPLYWERGADGAWREYGWRGMALLDPDAPVRHVSYYEADAFARWSGARLPTEAEWEAAYPLLAGTAGAAWEWTGSAYLPYPGFRPFAGAAGEYNGKFMSGQMVLRGGSEATPAGHARPTYRNFFHPGERWQIAGVRLAGDA